MIPAISYISSRFFFLSYGCCCNCCIFSSKDGCTSKKICRRRGEIEILKEDVLIDLYSNYKTKAVFTRYCLDDDGFDQVSAKEGAAGSHEKSRTSSYVHLEPSLEKSFSLQLKENKVIEKLIKERKRASRCSWCSGMRRCFSSCSCCSRKKGAAEKVDEKDPPSSSFEQSRKEATRADRLNSDIQRLQVSYQNSEKEQIELRSRKLKESKCNNPTLKFDKQKTPVQFCTLCSLLD